MTRAATGTGSACSRGTFEPASTSRLAPLRRMRAARWSSWNRLSSRSGSSSLRSRRSMTPQLLVDQRAAAPRQRLEHVADLQLQARLLAGQEHRLFVEFVDGVGDLPDLLGGVHRQRLDGPGRPAGPHPLELAGEVFVRDPQRAVAQPAQRPDQRAGHEQHDQRAPTGCTPPTIAESRIASWRLALAWSSTAEVTDDVVESMTFAAISLVACERLAQLGVADQHRRPGPTSGPSA